MKIVLRQLQAGVFEYFKELRLIIWKNLINTRFQ